MKLIFVAGAWGSGTSALMGLLDGLGVTTFGPFYDTRDPKTATSFEQIGFREIIRRHMLETTLAFKEDSSEQALLKDLHDFKANIEKGYLGDWKDDTRKRFALKLPLASACLPQIMAVFDTDILFVTRPIAQIEASRVRRGWPVNYGAEGAQHINSRTFGHLLRCEKSYLGVSYNDLRENTRESAKRIIDFCALGDLEANLETACRLIRKEK